MTLQQGPDTLAPCRSTACTTYLYDPRDKLVREVNGHGATTNYSLDAAGNITRELVSGDGAKDVTYAYTGQQLTSVSAGGAAQKYWYDPDGNLDCVTLSTGTQANCAPAAGGSYSAQVLAEYSYDYLDRMTQVRSFVTNGSSATKDDASDYEYDALDRVAEQTESHGAAGSPRTTLMSYLGLGTAVTQETQHDGDEGSDPLLTTKSYSYDGYGHRIGMTNAPTGGTAATSTYGYDVHGSVSLLLGDTGTATASYGYRAYGAADAELTKGDLNADNPLNAYRYSAKRLDSGSGSIDMGARRFGPDTARFLQRDVYNGATSDLGLALDPLTQNRYALAGGNPISFMEWDGHLVLKNGGGAAAPAPNPAQVGPHDGDPSTIADDGPDWSTIITATGAALATFEGGFGGYPSNLGRALHQSSGASEAVRKAAGTQLRQIQTAGLSRLSQFARSGVLRAGGWALVGVGAVMSYNEHLAEGRVPEEALVRTGVETGGAVAGGLVAAAGCGALGVATLGAGLLVCGGLALGLGFLGAEAGAEFGDVLHGEDPLQAAGDMVGKVGDVINFFNPFD